MSDKIDLVLLPDFLDDFIVKCIKNELKRNAHVERIYKKTNFLMRNIRKIHFNITDIFHKIWYPNLKLNIKYENIIIFDAIYNYQVLKDIKKSYPNSNFIYWYWNTVTNSEEIKKIKELGYDIWTFDEGDSFKYDLKKNTQFYFFKPTRDNKNQIESQDLYFIGLDKNRLGLLMKLKKALKEKKVYLKLEILREKKKKYNKNEIKNLIKRPKNYDEIISEIVKSKALLDIVKNNQKGITLRTMEGIYFDKKIITNNPNVINYKFYNKNNFYILGKEINLNEIEDFLKKDYRKYAEEELKEYFITTWLEKFKEVDNDL